MRAYVTAIGCLLVSSHALAQESAAPPPTPDTAPDQPTTRDTPPVGPPDGAEPPSGEAPPGAAAGEAGTGADAERPAAGASPELGTAAPTGEVAGEPAPTGEAPSPPAPPPEPAPAPEPQTKDAADAPPAEPPPEPGEEEIVVTGSRIRRTSFSSAAPVAVISREELEYSGAQNMGEVIRYMTAAAGSGINGDQGAWGTASLNLRGLGSNATLTLVNGRRLVPSGGAVGFFSDLNVIPVTAIDRIEILRGGASAIYGADAVAGVINVITRKDWEGARIEVTGKAADRFDQGDGEASLSLGSGGERSRGGLALSYARRTPLYARDRDWTRARDADGNVINDAYISDIGNPASFVAYGFPPVGMIGPNPDPDCGHPLAPGSFVNADGTLCSADFRQFPALIGGMERAAAFASGELDLTHHTTAFTELSVTHTFTDTAAAASFPVLREVFVPADHPDNVFGIEVQYFGSPLPSTAGATTITSTDDTLRAVVGLRGDFEGVAANTPLEDWEWEVSGSAGESRYRGDVPDTLVDEFQTALDSCTDPTDLSGCYNPFFSAHTGEGTPNSQSVLDSFSGRMAWITDSSLISGDAGLTGALFELPGGDFAFAVGAQLRREQRSTDQGIDAERLRYGFVLGNSDATADRTVGAGYLELVWPLYDGVELQTAGRIENSSTSGTDSNPTLGVVIAPAEIAGRDNVVDALRRLRVRGHLATAFRSPSIFQTFPGFATGITQFDGEGPAPVFRPTRGFGNPDLGPETAIALSAGIDWSPIDELALTSDLWHYDYEDIIVGDNALRLQQADVEVNGDPDYVNMAVCETLPCVRRDSSGGLLGVDTKLQNKPEVQTTGIDFGAVLRLDLGDGGSLLSVGTQGTIVLSYIIPRDEVNDVVLENGARARVEGCDADGCDVAGRRNNQNFAAALPRLKANFPVTWTDQTHSVNLVGHYISSYEDDNDPDLSPQGTNEPVARFGEIDAYFTLDLTYGYRLDERFGRATTFQVGVLNLTDEDPPAARGLPGFDAGTVDPRGRMIYGKLTQEF